MAGGAFLRTLKRNWLGAGVVRPPPRHSNVPAPGQRMLCIACSRWDECSIVDRGTGKLEGEEGGYHYISLQGQI